MAGRRVDEFDRPTVRSRVLLGVLCDLADRRHSASCSATSPADAQSRRARGDIPLAQHALLDASIAHQLGRAPSTISREILRNGGPDRYRATRSDQAAWDRALRPKPCKLACRPHLRRTISAKLQRKWSPEQIAGWLKRTYPVEPQNQVSHETIYRSLFIQARGVLKKELLEHLRAKRTIRRSRHASLKRNGLGQIKNAVSISEGPPSVEDRAVPGHWEGDLIGGSRNSYVATLVERHSRYVMLIKVANKDTESVVSALIKQSQRMPSELYQSLTWDRGKELADHKRLTLASDVESTSATLALPGSAAPTRTQTGCFASTCRTGPTYPCTAKPNSAPSLGSSTSGQERPCSTKEEVHPLEEHSQGGRKNCRRARQPKATV